MPAAARRTQLLQVALGRFAAGGYHDTSMDEIAEAAGVTKPVLYQHFHSKQELFRELLDSEGQNLLEEVAERAGAETNPYHMVLAGFQAYFQFVSNRTTAFQLLFGSGARVSEEFAESVRRVEEQMASVIAHFIDAEIDQNHRDLLAHAIVGLGEIAARRWVASLNQETERLEPEEAARLAAQLADLVWAGLRGLPGPDRHQDI